MAQHLTLPEIANVPLKALDGIDLRKGGAWLPEGDVHMRAWPYPYRAGLALSNDCDSQSIQCMRDWHGFVNGTGATAYGDGLGLEVGDSFWVYGNGLEPSLWKGNPFDETHVDGYAARAIEELAKRGFLDTLHSFGNWSARFIPSSRVEDPSIFAREQLVRGLDELDRRGIRPFVFVNHSGSPSNVGGPWASYQRSDDPADTLYAFDAMRAFGLRFFWIDVCTDIEKFGNELAYSSPDEYRRAAEAYAFAPWLRRKIDGRVEAIELPDDPADVQALMAAFFNRATIPVAARDGRMLHAFTRYRDIDQPVGATFPTQVTPAKLDMLEAQSGAVVVYQHFGVFGPRGRAPAVSRPHRRRSPLPALDRHSVATWREIAARASAGRLFVATQGRLLDWIWRRSSLQLGVTRAADRWTIALEGFECPVEGRREVGDADLNGLAITIPANAPDIVVTRPGRTGTLPFTRHADGEAHVLSLPWQFLEWSDDF